MRLPQLTFGKVLAGTAVVLVLTTGTAYAANTIASGDIINGEVKTQDLDSDAVTGSKIAPDAVGSSDISSNAVKSGDILNATITTSDVKNDTLTADDLASNSVGQLEIQTDGVAATEIQDNSIDAGEIVDFTLTNQDVGVLWAEVNSNGTLANQCSGCGVTSGRVGATGSYEVDFARTISSTCTTVATIGPAGGGSALGEVNVADRSGNAEAVFVDTNTPAGAAADLPFRLVVVC